MEVSNRNTKAYSQKSIVHYWILFAYYGCSPNFFSFYKMSKSVDILLKFIDCQDVDQHHFEFLKFASFVVSCYPFIMGHSFLFFSKTSSWICMPRGMC